MKQARIKALLNTFGTSILIHLLLVLVFLLALFLAPEIFISNKKDIPTPFVTVAPLMSAPKLSTLSKIGVQKEAEKPLKNDQRLGNDVMHGTSPAENLYANQLREIISTHQNYPILAQKRGLEGVVVIKIELSAQGDLISTERALKPFSAEISPILVESALHSVKSSSPFPPPPPEISRIFEIPIHYKISH